MLLLLVGAALPLEASSLSSEESVVLMMVVEFAFSTSETAEDELRFNSMVRSGTPHLKSGHVVKPDPKSLQKTLKSTSNDLD